MDEWEALKKLLTLAFKIVKLFVDNFEVDWMTVNFKRRKK